MARQAGHRGRRPRAARRRVDVQLRGSRVRRALGDVVGAGAATVPACHLGPFALRALPRDLAGRARHLRRRIPARPTRLGRRGVPRCHAGSLHHRASCRHRTPHPCARGRAGRDVLRGRLGGQIGRQDRERSRQARRADGRVPGRGGGVPRSPAGTRDAGHRSAHRRAAQDARHQDARRPRRVR